MDRMPMEGARPSGSSWAEDQLIPTECRQGSAEFEAALMAASAATRARIVAPVSVPSPEERLARLVRTIESDIIPRLMDAHRSPAHADLDAAANDEPQRPASMGRALSDVRPELDAARFSAAVLGAGDAELFAQVESLVADGCAIESLYMDLLAPTARHLGQMWADDRCNFADVTIATGRLQQLLRRLSPAFGQARRVPQDGRRVLLLPAPGEQHTLGLAMVADYFSRAGWLVSAGGNLANAEPISTSLLKGRVPEAATRAFVTETLRTVRRDWFDVIGISLGSSRGLNELRDFISELRRTSRNRGLGIIVGGPVFSDHPEACQAVGADATAASGRDAPGAAEQLLSQRVSRLR